MEHSYELIALRLTGRPGLGDDVAEHESKSAPRIACDALAAGGASASYSNRCSRREYTLPQLFALPVLRRFLRTDYRGIVAFAADWHELGEVLEPAKVSHRPTLAHAVRHLLAGAEKGDVLPAQAALIERAQAAGLVEAASVAVVDVADLETRYASAHLGCAARVRGTGSGAGRS